MPNGSVGDHPLTDILHHQKPVYSPEIDALTAEVVELLGQERTEALLTRLGILWAPRLVGPNAQHETRVQVDRDTLSAAGEALQRARDRALGEAEKGGWDIAALQERLEERRRAAVSNWRAEPGDG